MPIEAMRMGIPIFASDRAFVRSVCGEAATYFEPTDVRGTAGVLARHLKSVEKLDERVALGREIARRLPNAKQRAIEYIEIISSQIERGIS